MYSLSTSKQGQIRLLSLIEDYEHFSMPVKKTLMSAYKFNYICNQNDVKIMHMNNKTTTDVINKSILYPIQVGKSE
jgi:hypothetical protein